MPQNCDLPRAEKNKWIISTGSFNIVSVQPKPVLTDVCAKIVLHLFASTISTSLSSCISPSLSQPPHPSSRSSEAWLTWEHMSSLRQLSGLASGRVEKKKEGELQSPQSWIPEDHALGAWWAQSTFNDKKKTLSTCYGLFCYILSSLTQMSSTIPSLKMICLEDQTHRSRATH